MSKLKKIILECIIILLIIIIVIGCIFLKHNMNNNNYNTIEQVGEEIEEEEEQIDFETIKVEKVQDSTKYFTVETCISEYLNIINLNSSAYYGYNDKNQYTLIVDEGTIKGYIYNMLSEEYIEKNNITSNNVLNYVDKTKEDINFIPLEMNVLSQKDVEKYVVYGIETDNNNRYIKDIYIIVNIDLNNNTFSIEPINEKYDSIDKITIKNEIDEIKENDNNVYMNMKFDNEYLCKYYLNKYKKLSIAKPELAYKYLDEEYRKKRFGSLENFEEYINKNKKQIISVQCFKYYVEEYGNYTQYVIQDKYKNLYIFDVNTITDFSIKLDTYTIMTEKFKETYNRSDENEKVKMNIDKFFQMINRQDFKTSYGYLSKEFKNNYLKNEEEFENVAKKKFLLYNKIKFISCNKKGTNMYVSEIELTDLLEESDDTKTITIIMKLNEGTDFEMSFNIK